MYLGRYNYRHRHSLSDRPLLDMINRTKRRREFRGLVQFEWEGGGTRSVPERTPS